MTVFPGDRISLGCTVATLIVSDIISLGKTVAVTQFPGDRFSCDINGFLINCFLRHSILSIILRMILTMIPTVLSRDILYKNYNYNYNYNYIYYTNWKTACLHSFFQNHHCLTELAFYQFHLPMLLHGFPQLLLLVSICSWSLLSSKQPYNGGLVLVSQALRVPHVLTVQPILWTL